MHQNTWQRGFYKLSQSQRIQRLVDVGVLSPEEGELLQGYKVLSHLTNTELAENAIENSIGYIPVPLGVGLNFVIDGKARIIPMATEETSVIAAASSAAKWILKYQGSITTTWHGSFIIGQIQLPWIASQADIEKLHVALKTHQEEWKALMDAMFPQMVKRGGGMRGFDLRVLPRSDTQGSMAVLHVHYDAVDAMGANLINQICERLKPLLVEATGLEVGLCIVSNLVDTKVCEARVVLPQMDPALAQPIIEASVFAESDPYRAVTHNKGIMNGVDAVCLATGNDLRAVEAGAHAYALRDGAIRPLAVWKMVDKDLMGTCSLPMVVGTQGGVTKIHPYAQLSLKLLGVTTAVELGSIMTAVGLVQNLGALRALSSDGIVAGHMKLHAVNLALQSGAASHEVSQVTQYLLYQYAQDRVMRASDAKGFLVSLRNGTY